MNWLDDELKKALERKEPPTGFAGRVLERVEAECRKPGLKDRLAAWFSRPAPRWLAATAACAVLVAGINWERERRVQVEGERAKAQLMLALRIVSTELGAAQAKTRAISAAVNE